MPRRLPGIFMFLLVSVSVMRAQGDVALLTVAGETVGKEEFEYHFGKSSEKCAHVFAQAYGRFMQKVQWAKELGLDTLSAYRQQVDYYRQVLGSRAGKSGQRRYRQDMEEEWIKLEHVTCPLHQHESKRKEKEAKVYLDSVYSSLEKGREVLFEPLPWMQTRHLLPEWQTQVTALSKGEYSRPFYSSQGIHIVVWTDKTKGCPAGRILSDNEMSFRYRDFENGLLVASLDAFLEKALVCSESDLENHFKKHREKYGWGVPHYRGAVIHCRDKKEAKRIRKYLKKYPVALWMEAWERMPKDVSEKCRMEVGMFPIGKNPYVDKLVFKCGDYQPLDAYPYTWVLGKKLKKGPTGYRDVYEELEEDCRKAKKEAEMEAFMQKNKVEIDEEVLKTVNHYGNK